MISKSMAIVFCWALALVSIAFAQSPSRASRIGVLALADIPYVNDALRQGLREHGYVEGKNIEIDYRVADGDASRLPRLASELVRENVDLVVAMGAASARALKAATTSIPVVMAPVGNPVEAGFAQSLSRPGGNFTGVSVVSLDLAAKRVALAKELMPNAKRIAVLMTTTVSAPGGIMNSSRAAARKLGFDIQFVNVSSPSDLVPAFEAMKKEHADGFVAMPSPIFISEREHLADLAIQYHLPAIGETREFAAAGFVVGYGPSIADATRRSAAYVEKILKGANPAELPIEQPTNLEMTINLKTAKVLGLPIPQSLLSRADEVIQ
jgi:ABC-type uncharacterized transport system substrate-binding protein